MPIKHLTHITQDPTPEDTYWRARCEKEFDLHADPYQRDRYPVGYWKECYEYWQIEQEKKTYGNAK